ncbi:MAG TPA: DUF1330 domain-containing protein [Solirubrobacteraceae bacterium]|nr:DUF1330 domain-containing protein [Solirubrobacteraceae bacterium]
MAEQVVPSTDPRELLAGLPPDEPVVMINLLQFKHPDGAEHYRLYARGVVRHLESVRGRVLYSGGARAFVIGEGERPWWDAILVVEYPSPGAFLKMVADEDYLEVHKHREAALDRAELIATNRWLG